MPDRPRIAHVGIAVPDLDAALAFYRDVLGLEPASRRKRPTAPRSCRCPSATPRSSCSRRSAPDSPIARFLERRGPGIHHICYRVPDLDAALAPAAPAGYRLVDEVPRTGAGGRRIAFVHPKATAGILLELTE